MQTAEWIESIFQMHVCEVLILKPRIAMVVVDMEIAK